MKWTNTLVKTGVWLAVLGGAAYGVVRFLDARKTEAAVVHYRTARVVRTDIFRTVEATGTVQPIKEVEVGAQVNGRIVKLFVDYNSVVTNGQVVALIDPQVYEANYKSALGELHANEANVKKCEAQLALAEKTLTRKRELVKKEMAPVADYDSALEARDTGLAALAAAKASVEKSQASVSQAKANLDYCTILSPVDGVVITRSVDEGQTVVSSMNAVPLHEARDRPPAHPGGGDGAGGGHRERQGRAGRHLHGRFLRGRHLHGRGHPGAHGLHHDVERRHLSRDHRGREPGREALPRHDGQHLRPRRRGARRACRHLRRIPLPSCRRGARRAAADGEGADAPSAGD